MLYDGRYLTMSHTQTAERVGGYISEVRGSESGLSDPPNREIDFDFDSIVRAGEAKLCGCVRAVHPHR